MNGRLALLLVLLPSLAVAVPFASGVPACQAPEGYASFFIDRNVIVNNANGIIGSVNKGCACRAGTQYAYKAINPKYDFSALRTISNLTAGLLSCARQEDLVVETSDGQLLHGVKGQYVDVQPVPYTNRQGKTRMYLTVAVHGSNIANGWATVNATTLDWSIQSQNNLSGESVASETRNNGNTISRRLNFAERSFISIIGVYCNGGQRPIKYCDATIKQTYAR